MLLSLTFLIVAVMELLQDFLHLLRNRQTKMGCVFQKADTFIGDVEENNRRSQHTAVTDDIGIQDVCHADHRKNQHLSTNALKSDRTGKVLVHHSTHDSRDIIHNHENNQSVKQTVKPTEKPAEPTTDGGKDDLNGVP